MKDNTSSDPTVALLTEITNQLKTLRAEQTSLKTTLTSQDTTHANTRALAESLSTLQTSLSQVDEDLQDRVGEFKTKSDAQLEKFKTVSRDLNKTNKWLSLKTILVSILLGSTLGAAATTWMIYDTQVEWAVPEKTRKDAKSWNRFLSKISALEDNEANLIWDRIYDSKPKDKTRMLMLKSSCKKLKKPKKKR